MPVPASRFVLPRRAALALALCAGIALPALAQPSPNDGPFRTIDDGDDARLMLEGYDAVGYFAEHSAIKGDPGIKLEHRGVIWRFASEAHKAAFLAAPEKYMPQFGGYCSNGIDYAIPGGGGGRPDTWRIYRGRLYVFGGQQARDHFEMDTERNLERAHRYWNEEVAGSNPLMQRLRRMLFRVEHYRSDRSLQKEWEERLAEKSLPVMPGATQVVPEE